MTTVKTYILEKVASVEQATIALRKVLPGQESPWLLRDAHGDAIAYFNVREEEIGIICPAIVADVSGRHSHEHAKVLDLLRELQEHVGGRIVPEDC